MHSRDAAPLVRYNDLDDMRKKRTSINWDTVQPPEVPLSQVLEEARSAYVHRPQDEIDELVDRAVKRAKQHVPEATRPQVLNEQERQLPRK